jgi:PAS domain S-box-containing protein
MLHVSYYPTNGDLTPIAALDSSLYNGNCALGFPSEHWAEEAQQETQLRLAALVDSVLDGIITLDADDRIIMCNPAAEKMFRYSAGELVGRPFNCLLIGALRPSTDPKTAPDPEATDFPSVLRGVRSSGEEFPLETSISQVALRGRTFFTLILRDLSERLRVEAALAQSEECFRQAQKMEALGQLAGGVAHDFNNLLTVISGHTDLLLAGVSENWPMRDSLAEIQRASLRAASLTRQLLAFSRKQVLAPRVLDLNALIPDTEKMLRRLIGENVTLETRLASDLRPVKIDPGQMEQVVLNLVVNARDAMPKGGRLVLETFNADFAQQELKRHPKIPPQKCVVLSVADSGCGMTPEVQARIFEPFFTTKGAAHGTGLGLAIVQRILKQNGGQVSVRSEIGVGTTFQIFLPSVQECPVAVPLSNVEQSMRGSETVLLAEDEEALRYLGSTVLERYGYTVLLAADAKEALRKANSHKGKIHLLLTDIVMPGMDGFQLAKALRSRQPDLKVIFSTGYSDDSAPIHKALRRGSAFLSKPFSPDALAAKVRQVLDTTSY